MNSLKNKFSNILLLTLLFGIFLSPSNTNAQCGSCTNPTGIVTVGFGESICYDVSTSITGLTVFFDGMVTICDGVILTVTGTTQLSGTAQIIMNNCSELYQIGSFTCSSSNAFIYAGDNTCAARFTIESASDLCAPLTSNSYIQYCNLNGSPTTGSPGAATVGCGLPLPIELIAFTTSVQNESQILLQWSTASENNNDFFTIERSKDMINWENVTTIDGARNSSQKLNYNAIDYSPYLNTSYYRIKQTDFDGKFSYSDIISVDLEENELSILIYPNPTNSIFNIKGDENELSELKIFNILGENITTSTLIIENSSKDKTVDLKNLPEGVYILKTKTTTHSLLKK